MKSFSYFFVTGDPECIEIRKPPPKCVDKINDCANKIGVCDNMAYRKYALDNCCNYCNLGHELITPSKFFTIILW